MTKLSIIITLYKSEEYIRKCLDSIYAQNLSVSDFEVVVVDDGSPDKSAEIAEEYGNEFHNLKVLRQENKGLAEARNVGIKNSSGKYIRFVDPDDYIEPAGSAALLEKMDKEELDMLRFNYNMVDEDYQTMSDPKSKKHIDYRDEVTDGKSFLGKRLGFACYVWTFIYNSALIKDNNIYFIPASYFDDVHWLPRVLIKAERITSVSSRESYYLQRPGSLVKTDSREAVLNKIEGQFSIIEMLSQQAKEQNDNWPKKWFRAMMAHTVISMLGVVSRMLYASRTEYVQALKERDVFPLRIYNTKMINHLHVFLINRSPLLYCSLIYARGKRK